MHAQVICLYFYAFVCIVFVCICEYLRVFACLCLCFHTCIKNIKYEFPYGLSGMRCTHKGILVEYPCGKVWFVDIRHSCVFVCIVYI